MQLFCPEFTVAPAGGAAGKKGSSSSGVGGGGASSVRDEAEDLQTLDSCEYIWAPGVGFARLDTTFNFPQRTVSENIFFFSICSKVVDSPQYDLHRRELLRLLETCFSQTMYLPPVAEAHNVANRWFE